MNSIFWIILDNMFRTKACTRLLNNLGSITFTQPIIEFRNVQLGKKILIAHKKPQSSSKFKIIKDIHPRIERCTNDQCNRSIIGQTIG